MQRTTFRRLIITALLVFGTVLPAHAGLIVLSGDTNILNPVNGSGGVPINAGNQQFLTNVLGGSTTALVHNNCLGCSGTIAGAPSIIDTYYNGLSGVSSSLHSGAITAAALAGVDLFVSILPATAYSAAEILALAGWGGDILFIGENGNFTFQNNNINAALAALGSSMSLLNNIIDSGFHTATGVQIASDALTAGISSFVYAAPSEVMVSGGTALFFGTGGEAFVAYDGMSVPEPSTLLLFGAGLIGFALVRRRRSVP